MSRRAKSPSYPLTEQLELFLKRAKRLEDTQLAQTEVPTTLKMSWDRERGLRVESVEPDEDMVSAYLMHFRPFISDNSPVFLFKIYNLLLRFVTSAEIKEELIKGRTEWANAVKQNGFNLNLNGQEYSPETVTDLWINGYYFHDDPEKLRLLESLAPLEHGLFRQKFYIHLGVATGHIVFVRNIIRRVLEENLLDESSGAVAPLG